MEAKVKTKSGKEKSLKITFWQKLNISIVNFEHYYVIAADGWKKAILYLMQLLLIFAIVLTCFVSYKTSSILKGVCDYAKNELPECGIKNNQFWINSSEPIIIDNGTQTKIVIDDKNPVSTYTNDNKNSNKDLIVISKDSIYFNNNYAGEMNYSLQNIGTLFSTSEFTKNDLIDILSNGKLYATVIVYIFIAVYIMYFISMIIDIIALSAVGYMTSRIIGLPLKFSATFGMATSAMSLPIILTLCYFIANISTGFNMPYFQIMITIISYIYMIFALIIMRSNLLSGDDKGESNIKKGPIKKVDKEDGSQVDED